MKFRFATDVQYANFYLHMEEMPTKGTPMETVKLIQDGSSQLIRLPINFKISTDEVQLYRQGNKIILEPIEKSWNALFESLIEFPDDFFPDGRQQPEAQVREFF